MTAINFVHQAHLTKVTGSIHDARMYSAITGNRELKYVDYLTFIKVIICALISISLEKK
jgi:hypothetical protein